MTDVDTTDLLRRLVEEAAKFDVPFDVALESLPRAWSAAIFQAQRTDEARHVLIEMLSVPSSTLTMSPATVRQAERNADLRARLLATGAHCAKDLASGRHQTPQALRQWLSRQRNQRRLFTVNYDRQAWVPAFLLDSHLEPRPELLPALDVLMRAGLDGWALWAWLALPSPYADGARPIDLDPEALTEVARRRAAAEAA